MKVCKTCILEQDTSNFHKCAANKDGLHTICKTCDGIRLKSWYRDNAKHVRKTFLKRQYGLSVEELELMYKQQENMCKICGLENKLAVDHCHTTGRVRGLLCQKCNQGLGNFKDNTEYLLKAIEYLKN